MNRIRKLALAPVAMAVMFVAGSGPVMAADSLTDAFREGDWGLDFRYRIEIVDQDGFDNNAEASTLRSRLNFGTADLNGFSAFAEVDYVLQVVLDDYNAGGGNSPDRIEYPVVADPDGADLNQVYLQYKNGNNKFRVGRQRIILDNARFVGNVGWRQNEQTYDALSWRNEGGLLDIQYAFVNNVNRIFGDDVPAGEHEQETHLFNISHSFEGLGKLTGYWYDIDNDDDARFSTTTFGARLSGSFESLGYAFEIATQSDNGNNPVDYSAKYWRGDLSYKVGGVTPYAGYEVLGGDKVPGKAFRTPLATLHAFNGWADKFLGTPPVGLEDAFLGIKGKAGSWSWNVVYHDFSAEAVSRDLGTELDASISTKFAKRYGLLFKFADFNTDSPGYDDTSKYWVMFTAGF
jgi:hypothetical protein